MTEWSDPVHDVEAMTLKELVSVAAAAAADRERVRTPRMMHARRPLMQTVLPNLSARPTLLGTAPSEAAGRTDEPFIDRNVRVLVSGARMLQRCTV